MKRFLLTAALVLSSTSCAFAQGVIDPANKFAWQENAGWTNWADANLGTQSVLIDSTYLSGFIWCENLGWVNTGDGTPTNGISYANVNGTDFGVNVDGLGNLTGFAWGENVGWINFSGGALATPAQPARIDFGTSRLRGYAWCENLGWLNLDDATHFVGVIIGTCGSPDFDGDGDQGTDLDIEAFFACIGGDCCGTCGSPDFDGDGDQGTDLDIEAFFRVLGGGAC